MLGIFAPRRYGRLFISDALNISRDPTLVFAVLMSIVPAIAFTFGERAMNDAAAAAFGIEGFARYVAPVALCLPAFLVGWVTGFLFLEDRDEGALMAVDVTPAGKAGFMSYRISITAILAIAITLFGAPLILPDARWPMIMLLAAMVAIEAVCAALILPALARNKVEGLAITKLTNIASLAPLLAIIPSPLRYLGGFVPTFWIGELLGLSGKHFLPTAAIVALTVAVHLGTAILIFRQTQRRAG